MGNFIDNHSHALDQAPKQVQCGPAPNLRSIMQSFHKDKTLTTLLAALLGGIGIHRFYLRGRKDPWGWLHLASIPLSAIVISMWPTLPSFFALMPLVLSGLIALIEGLVLGLTPDDRWDATYNSQSTRQSHSQWPLALLLVLMVGTGATGLIAVIARSFDLLYTGGSYG